MNVTKESILGVGMDTSLAFLNWLRPNTPCTNDGKTKLIDSVEFEISHKGIEKLERNIHNENEFIMCFVHFEAGTENVDCICMSVWDEDSTTDDNIDINILTDEEKTILIEYALEELRMWRNCG